MVHQLVESLKDKMGKFAVSNALDTLTDWGIIDGEYGETENGRAGYLYRIDMERHGDHIKALYRGTLWQMKTAWSKPVVIFWSVLGIIYIGSANIIQDSRCSGYSLGW